MASTSIALKDGHIRDGAPNVAHEKDCQYWNILIDYRWPTKTCDTVVYVWWLQEVSRYDFYRCRVILTPPPT
jgi:hypothetical protein